MSVVASLWNTHVHLLSRCGENAAVTSADSLSAALQARLFRWVCVRVVDTGSPLENTCTTPAVVLSLSARKGASDPGGGPNCRCGTPCCFPPPKHRVIRCLSRYTAASPSLQVPNTRR